jgi:hypothetical protein
MVVVLMVLIMPVVVQKCMFAQKHSSPVLLQAVENPKPEDCTGSNSYSLMDTRNRRGLKPEERLGSIRHKVRRNMMMAVSPHCQSGRDV